MIEHHHPALDHVGGYRTKGNGQQVEIRFEAGLGHVATQQVFDAARVYQARRDHERFGTEPAANGTTTSIMRHLISNAQVTLTGTDTATGTCYVTTVVKKGDIGPAILSISRYTDRYARQNGEWRIQRREITIEFGNGALGKQLGFGGG